MFSEELKKKAQVHYDDIKDRLKSETKKSIANSTIYKFDIDRTRELYYRSSFKLVDLDSVSCAFSTPIDARIAILNFASYKSPGGFFLEGSTAQEEALCHESNLYPILLSFKDSYYEENKKNLNRALYRNKAIYSPDVVFEHNGEQRLFDVITCAAPNFTTAKRYQNVTLEENDKVFLNRMNFLYKIVEKHNVDILIAGAWGCGVFGQHPGRTCRMMLDSLFSIGYNIPQVYFAIPNPTGRNPNFIQFKKVIDSYV